MQLGKAEDGVVEFFRNIHQSVAKASKAYQAQLGRWNHVTPTSYLELLDTYKKTIWKKREEVGALRSKLNHDTMMPEQLTGPDRRRTSKRPGHYFVVLGQRISRCARSSKCAYSPRPLLLPESRLELMSLQRALCLTVLQFMRLAIALVTRAECSHVGTLRNVCFDALIWMTPM